jgi:hypothetical protein
LAKYGQQLDIKLVTIHKGTGARGNGRANGNSPLRLPLHRRTTTQPDGSGPRPHRARNEEIPNRRAMTAFQLPFATFVVQTPSPPCRRTFGKRPRWKAAGPGAHCGWRCRSASLASLQLPSSLSAPLGTSSSSSLSFCRIREIRAWPRWADSLRGTIQCGGQLLTRWRLRPARAPSQAVAPLPCNLRKLGPWGQTVLSEPT